MMRLPTTSGPTAYSPPPPSDPLRSSLPATGPPLAAGRLPYIEPDDDVDRLPIEAEFDEAYDDLESGMMDDEAAAAAQTVFALRRRGILSTAVSAKLSQPPRRPSPGAIEPLPPGSAPPPPVRRGALRFRTSAEVALMCTNVVRSVPRMRKRKRSPSQHGPEGAGERRGRPAGGETVGTTPVALRPSEGQHSPGASAPDSAGST
ncbi:hypothetical protein P8C59_004097 [Phyllachora maydis]|uniref:Uncharacterized protein n=1 Tax=Phyllachora maydis TaxID=1825666 RepID=A0AAD9I306_9PEZI|nr:hypothetical protein P8C59_004097 [Phyllachora maydis]